jgi:hypothetical protein
MRDLTKTSRERKAIETLQEQETASMHVRISELEYYYRLIYNSIWYHSQIYLILKHLTHV